MTDVTAILCALDAGNARTEELLALVYDELRRMAEAKIRHEHPGHSLQATALVHEAFLRLVGDEQATWRNRRHFFGAAATAMQRILVEQARQRQQKKRGGEFLRVELKELAVTTNDQPSDTQLLALNEALQSLENEDPSKAELVKLRYFAGLTEEEAALALNISRATASRWWTFAKAWLFQRLRETD